MRKAFVTFVAAMSLVGMPHAPLAAAPADDVVVKVTRDGNTFELSAKLTIPAELDLVWDVLTDFDNMATILSNVDQSRIANRDGNRFEVIQKSHATAGPLRLSTDRVREVQLTPKREIKSQLIKGDLKSSDFVTRIEPAGGLVRVTVSRKFVTGGLSGAAITPEAVQSNTRRQYQEMREEVIRRKNNEPTPPCVLTKSCPRAST
jgi:hypothetical protein